MAVIIGRSRVEQHCDLCDLVARNLKTDSGAEELKVLPHFSRLADAGVDAMDAVWGELSGEPQCQVRSASSRVAGLLDHLSTASKAWKKLDVQCPAGEAVVRRFATSICEARSDQERLLALIQHHEQYGVRWRDAMVFTGPKSNAACAGGAGATHGDLEVPLPLVRPGTNCRAVRSHHGTNVATCWYHEYVQVPARGDERHSD